MSQHHVFIKRSTDHRDLHSFPTRRSSDLTKIFHEMGVLPALEAAGLVKKYGAQFHIGDGSKSLLLNFRNGHLDRKSTRLNSSHLGISYAVFCLKKKNNNNNIIDLDNEGYS